MNIKVAIHHRQGSFSEKWIEYCQEYNINHTIVDAKANDIIEQLHGHTDFLWHWHHSNHSECLSAKFIINAAERMGIRTFPNTNTCWSFDNKIAQKYQLEAINAPLVPTYIFYDKNEALNWIKTTTWPKVFKLSRGAGSKNVRLIKNIPEANKLINTAFTHGFKPAGGQARDAFTRIRSKSDRKRVDWIGKFKRLPNTLKKIKVKNNFLGKDIGYFYFQDFIPNNQYDIRITVIGDRAFGYTRNVREKDFRASGSGNVDYDKSRIPLEAVKIAFQIAHSLKAQSIAYDFVKDECNNIALIETSYCYISKLVYECKGYWDSNLNWHNGNVWPEFAILSDLLQFKINI